MENKRKRRGEGGQDKKYLASRSRVIRWDISLSFNFRVLSSHSLTSRIDGDFSLFVAAREI